MIEMMYWFLGNWSIFLTGRDMVLGGKGGVVSATEGEILIRTRTSKQQKSSVKFIEGLTWKEAISLIQMKLADELNE